MSKPPKTLPEADPEKLWDAVAREVKPLRKKRKLPPPKLAPGEPSKRAIKAKAPSPARVSARSLYDAQIDLHGMTEAGAHPVLMDFVQRQRARGALRLLVITGKGSGASKNSVLRTNVPRWLDVEPFASFITAVEPAPAVLGSEGAFIVRLKKPR